MDGDKERGEERGEREGSVCVRERGRERERERERGSDDIFKTLYNIKVRKSHKVLSTP